MGSGVGGRGRKGEGDKEGEREDEGARAQKKISMGTKYVHIYQLSHALLSQNSSQIIKMPFSQLQLLNMPPSLNP